jgi:uncharacterized RDD family membrane protein YckC
MINDSVREELVGKISAASKSNSFEIKVNIMSNKTSNPVKSVITEKTVDASQSATSKISAKLTSPTLVEFHSKNAAVPEWRLQLQNAVRQHQERGVQETEDKPIVAGRAQLVTSGANALKIETVPETTPVTHKNPSLTRALERIETSRQKFLVEEKPATVEPASPPKANKNYPFHIAPKTIDAASKPAEINAPVNSFAKPKLAAALRTETRELDTNKLPPIPKPAQTAASFVETLPSTPESQETKLTETETIEVKVADAINPVEAEEIEAEEYDDCAPFAVRFNAGLFDLIIGSFTSLILLAPFMAWSGSWFSTAGIFAFLATCSIVMFIYLTTAVGLYGKTFAMRLFSLEIVDIESEDYPTLHQAAVSAAVYLLSLALGGIGFLTVLFNEDKRAAHDLISGTIVVKE